MLVLAHKKSRLKVIIKICMKIREVFFRYMLEPVLNRVVIVLVVIVLAFNSDICVLLRSLLAIGTQSILIKAACFRRKNVVAMIWKSSVK